MRSMIRLLESQRFQVDTSPRSLPISGNFPTSARRQTWRSTCSKTRCCDVRLLAGGARIHIDFHAARHFDDLRCFPGHFGSPCKRDDLTPSAIKLSCDEKFASEFFREIFTCVSPSVPCCSAAGQLATMRLRAKSKGDQGFLFRSGRKQGGQGAMDCNEYRIKNL